MTDFNVAEDDFEQAGLEDEKQDEMNAQVIQI